MLLLLDKLGRSRRRSSHGLRLRLLQEPFDPAQALQDELVASVELDAWFAVDAFRAELRAQPAARLSTVATGFPSAADLALQK
jgi:hypothetical protein